jgi:hypothetical protein
MTLEISDALSFFRLSCGRWKSQRSQHHLLHRRAEAGASFIVVEELLKGDERLAEIATRNGEDVSKIIGGCWVRWSGSMAWDRAGESHEDQTMFGLIPSDDAGREGLLLRDRGYAEKAPVAGQFRMDDENGLILTTDYEMMSSLERFWFAGPNLRLRTSTVQGLSNNASFCMETRQLDDALPKTSSVAAAATQLAPVGW